MLILKSGLEALMDLEPLPKKDQDGQGWQDYDPQGEVPPKGSLEGIAIALSPPKLLVERKK